VANDVLRLEIGKAHHVAFLHHPASKAKAAQDERIALLIDDPLMIGANKSVCMRRRRE